MARKISEHFLQIYQVNHEMLEMCNDIGYPQFRGGEDISSIRLHKDHDERKIGPHY